MNVYQKKIYETIEIYLDNDLDKNKLGLDYTITGTIVSENNGVYTILYNDSFITAKARDGLNLLVNDVVYIRVVQGNFSEKFIDCKKP